MTETDYQPGDTLLTLTIDGEVLIELVGGPKYDDTPGHREIIDKIAALALELHPD